jgi:hypothetical protein
MKVLLTDTQQPDTDLEHEMLQAAGIECAVAQCRSPEDVIQAGQGVDAFVASYAPITGSPMCRMPT